MKPRKPRAGVVNVYTAPADDYLTYEAAQRYKRGARAWRIWSPPKRLDVPTIFDPLAERNLSNAVRPTKPPRTTPDSMFAPKGWRIAPMG